MKKNTCPVCSKGNLVESSGGFRIDILDRWGDRQTLTVPDVRRLQCDSCGEEILDDVATRQIEAARRNAVGLMTPAEMHELRLRFGKTQVQMSRLLGVGEKTYCRWESGAFIQSVALDNYLRLIREIPEAVVMLAYLQEYGVTEFASTTGEEEFTFLKDTEVLSEPAAKFTQQMISGTLHACSV